MKAIKRAGAALTMAALLTGVVSLTGCEGMNTRQRDTALGAGAGGVAGAVMGGGALGTIGGAAVGGIIGNQVGK